MVTVRVFKLFEVSLNLWALAALAVALTCLVAIIVVGTILVIYLRDGGDAAKVPDVLIRILSFAEKLLPALRRQ